MRAWIPVLAAVLAATGCQTHRALRDNTVRTSATLTDGSGTAESWSGAEARTGARHLPKPAFRVRVPSPFDYVAQTRVIIVTDLVRDDMDQIASAYRALFLAAKGGALGLFTAISRLRAVHRRIAPALEEAGIDLLAHASKPQENTIRAPVDCAVAWWASII